MCVCDVIYLSLHLFIVCIYLYLLYVYVKNIYIYIPIMFWMFAMHVFSHAALAFLSFRHYPSPSHGSSPLRFWILCPEICNTKMLSCDWEDAGSDFAFNGCFLLMVPHIVGVQ